MPDVQYKALFRHQSDITEKNVELMRDKQLYCWRDEYLPLVVGCTPLAKHKPPNRLLNI